MLNFALTNLFNLYFKVIFPQQPGETQLRHDNYGIEGWRENPYKRQKYKSFNEL